jgi:ATP-dependent helicase HepA
MIRSLKPLKRIVKEKIELPNRRLMVFSTFRHTLGYLFDNLLRDGFRVGLVHGDIPDDERNDVRRRFQLEPAHPDAIDVLLFSEVGSEGLDYQFCPSVRRHRELRPSLEPDAHRTAHRSNRPPRPG